MSALGFDSWSFGFRVLYLIYVVFLTELAVLT